MLPRNSGGQIGPMVSRTYNSTNAYDERQKLPPKYAKPPIANNKYPYNNRDVGIPPEEVVAKPEPQA